MSKFNPDLIQKARKGEIAILNDGSADELQSLLKEVWPRDEVIPEGVQKYYVRLNDEKWDGRSYTDLPHHSVKDFFMPDTSKLNLSPQKQFSDIVEKEAEQPRTYKVTRGQMKEIWEAANNEGQHQIREWMDGFFGPFDNEADVGGTFVQNVLHVLGSEKSSLLKSIFPSYFYIPEGEPVLVRSADKEAWSIYISDGSGGVYVNSYVTGDSCTWKQIIPFTKNPPQ